MEDGFIRGAVGGHGSGWWFRKGTQRTDGTDGTDGTNGTETSNNQQSLRTATRANIQ